MRENILIIDSFAAQRQEKERALRQVMHYQPVAMSDVTAAIAYIQSGKEPLPDIILLDMEGSAVMAADAVQRLVSTCPDVPVIAMTSYADYNHEVDRLVEAGAYDCLCKPVPSGRLRMSIQHALTAQRMRAYITWLERKMSGHASINDMVGDSHDFLEAKALAEQAAKSRMPVWLEGEAGVGKSFFARAIHGSGHRVGKPFIVVNCEMLPPAPHTESYILNKMREADQGTLLFKEAGALAPALQQTIIDIFRSGKIPAIEGRAEMPYDVRLMFSTRMPAKYAAEGQALRQKLTLLGQLITIALLPLRARRGDIDALAKHFLVMHSVSENKYISEISDAALEWLRPLYWPENIGQLNHLLWRAVMACEGKELGIADLQAVQKDRSITMNNGMTLLDTQGKVRTLKDMQEEAIRFALKASNGCMTRAAKSLGIGRSTLYRKLSEFSINDYTSRANQTMRPTMKISSTGAS